MFLTKSEFLVSLAALMASSVIEERAIGENFSLEENVGGVRCDHFQNHPSSSSDLREAADAYFRASIQGIVRGHIPSTFVPSINDVALLPSTLERNQKIVRLERIDQLMSVEPDLDFDRLSQALADHDTDTLTAFTNLFATFPGERPAFAAFKAEVDDDLGDSDWLRRLVDRMGLYHHYPIAGGQVYSFALMEYMAAEVFSQAQPKCPVGKFLSLGNRL